MARITAEREANLKEWENKPTGKMIFESMNKASFEDITFEEPEENEEVKEEDEEEMVEDFVYDRALFKPGEAEEEIDFDDDKPTYTISYGLVLVDPPGTLLLPGMDPDMFQYQSNSE